MKLQFHNYKNNYSSGDKTMKTRSRTVPSMLIFIGMLIASTFCSGNEEKNIKIFQQFNPDSSFTITYPDIDSLYKATVLPMGFSSRTKAHASKPSIGTRMKAKVNRYTAYEANRFIYESFQTEAQKGVLTIIRKSLEQLPDELALDNFSKNEQLAYWLNLYNVTLIEELVKIYPRKSLKRLIIEKSNTIFSKPLLMISGVAISLNDIQHKILWEKFGADPLIIYGLYQGIIGGPNIRPVAFYGANVFEALKDNANEFVNSNRGTFSLKLGSFRVSSLYERNKQYFPSFHTDLTKHLLVHMNGDLNSRLDYADEIEPNIDDWNIADLYGTQRTYGAGVASNPAALLSSSGRPKITGFQLHFDGENLTREPIGNAPGGGAGNAGIGSIGRGTMSEGMLNGTLRNGRLSDQQIQALKALFANRELPEGNIEITQEESTAD